MESDIGIIKASGELLKKLRSCDFEKDTDGAIKILDVFLEESHLLDPVLGDVVGRCVGAIIPQSEYCAESNNLSENEKDVKTLDEEHGNGGKGKERQANSCTSMSSAWPYTIIYSLCRVRGYKTVSKFLPSDTEYLEDTLEQLELSKSWMQTYCLLIWMSILIMVPFKLDLFGADIKQRLFDGIYRYLAFAGKERDAASIAMARLLSRADCADLAVKFFDESWPKYKKEGEGDLFFKLGFLQTTANIWKNVNGSDPGTIQWIIETIQHFGDGEEKRTNTNVSLARLHVKNYGKIGMILVRARNGAYFPQIERVLRSLLQTLSHSDSTVRYASAKAYARLAQELQKSAPTALLSVVSRVTQRLESDMISPSETNDDNSLALKYASVEKWHGYTLCLAELLRRAMVPRQHLTQVADILKISLHFEQQRLTYTTGTNVRDAGCYAVWAMARAYRKLDTPLLDSIVGQLCLLCCFDPETSIRRAASAALQETVGRQQWQVQKGIDLIQTVDYFKVGQRTTAYTQVACKVKEIGVKGLSDYVAKRILGNWDRELRKLGGKALKELDEPHVEDLLATELDKAESGPLARDADRRHGVLYALGDINIKKKATIEALAKFLETGYSEADFETKMIQDTINAEGFLHGLVVVLKQNNMDRNDPGESDFNEIMAKRLLLSLDVAETLDPGVVCELEKVIVCMSARPTVRLSLIDLKQWMLRARGGRSGYVVALGCVGPANEELDVSAVMGCLADIIHGRESVVNMGARRQAVIALTRQIGQQPCNGNTDLYVSALVDGLYDYTRDERGDVGSWVRESAMTGIVQHKRLICGKAEQGRVIGRLLSMCVEVLVRLRGLAWVSLTQVIAGCDGPLSLLRERLKGMSLSSALPVSSPPSSPCVAAADTQEYFYSMLQIIEEFPEYRSEFMGGYVMSAGAQMADVNTIRVSAAALAQYITEQQQANCEQQEKGILHDVLIELVKIVDSKLQSKSRVTCGLRTWARLLQGGVNTLTDATDAGSGIQQLLFIKTFNSHINTRDIERVQAAIDVFIGLGMEGHIQSVKRLATLCASKVSPTVRMRAAEGLYEVASIDYPEITPTLENTDWGGTDIKELGEKVQEMLQTIDR